MDLAEIIYFFVFVFLNFFYCIFIQFGGIDLGVIFISFLSTSSDEVWETYYCAEIWEDSAMKTSFLSSVFSNTFKLYSS